MPLKNKNERAASRYEAAQGISRLEDCENIVDGTIAELGAIDVLVNNSGIDDSFKGVLTTMDERLDDVVGLDLTGLFYMCRATMRHMTAAGSGVIVNVSSVGGVFFNAETAYSATKAGVIGLTTVLRHGYTLQRNLPRSDPDAF